ncbi:hypothetical protein Pla100_43620 [Neorhodopirellula pilleata]|uniref:Alpha/beta hydrolase family protein n=2 Tax=Neorhodopirellula pilleata TaxID=2714738 RepID=A0A5C6A0V2_9BACT|nr:hypothetical protein Pla100_43620 [Neorhodopirellula pilleata]
MISMLVVFQGANQSLRAEPNVPETDAELTINTFLPAPPEFLTATSVACPAPTASRCSNDGAISAVPSSLTAELKSDRLWLISTRSISSNACRINLRDPNFRISRLDHCGRQTPSDLNEYLATMDTTRPRIIYIHGNRRDASAAIAQGIWVYREIARNRPTDQPFDWVIWSWPSEAESILLSDVRKKAERTDAQGLYLAWLLTHHHANAQPTGLIGFSFGGRIVSGGLHALAGGVVGRRTLDQPPIRGAEFDVGMLAPAVDSTWLSSCGHHRYASQNMNRMVLLYNHRDFALKYFRMVSQDPHSQALGYTGPRPIAPRHDGTQLPIRSRDCANTVGNHHSEKQYYQNACYAGREMASLIESSLITN